MKAKRHFFSRRSKTRTTTPRRNQTSPSHSEDEEYTIDSLDKRPRSTSGGDDVQKSMEQQESLKLGGITESWNSFSSNGSGETTASDMMKCLQALRIQDISVTNSTPTPSASSIPRLAPPPLSSRGSVHSNSTEACQTWPNIQIRSIESVPGHMTRKSDGMSTRRVSDSAQEHAEWVAFASPFESAPKQRPVQNIEVHADVAAAASECSKSPSLKTESEKSEENGTMPTENNSQPLSPVTDLPIAGASTWEGFGDHAAFPSSTQESAKTMETVKEESLTEDVLKNPPLRPPPRPPIMRTQRTGSSTRSNDIGGNAEAFAKVPMNSPWVDSDEDAFSVWQETPAENNPFASGMLSKRKSSGCSLASKGGDALFQSVLSKYGAPQLELVETVNAYFSGNALTRYTVWGEAKFKLSGAASDSADTALRLSSRALECLEFYHLVLRLKCVLQHVFLKHVIAKKSLLEWNDQPLRISRQSSLTMNEARKGLVESKVMHWNLGRCYQEALSMPITLLRYPVQSKTLAGPPLRVQIQWQRPKKPGQPVLVDISLIPNRRLSTSLWGVTVCLKGFGESLVGAEALACPEARWNSTDAVFEWSIPMINPDDAVQHLRVKVTENPENPCPDYHLSTTVKFVMPHSTLSGTLLLGWLERRDATPTEPLFGEETSIQEPDLIFCEKMCLSGNYEADINYGSK